MRRARVPKFNLRGCGSQRSRRVPSRHDRVTLQVRPETGPVPDGMSAPGHPGFRRATLDLFPARVAVLDGRGVILAVNAAWLASAEADKGTGVGTNYLEAFDRSAAGEPQSAGGRVGAGLRELLAGVREDLVIEYCGEGREPRRWFTLRAVRTVHQGATTLVVQLEDATARRASEATARFGSELLDAVDAAVIAHDPEGLVVAWNRGAERLYGWSHDEALGRPAATLLLPAPSSKADGNAMARPHPDGHWEGRQEMLRKDGSRFCAYVRDSTLLGPDDRVLGYVGVSIDLTEQVQIEGDLRSAHNYMRAVADSMGDGLCTLDTAGRIVYVNARVEELLGWSSAELAGQDMHEALHHTRSDGSPFPADQCALVAARGDGESARVEDDCVIRRDGTLLPVQQVQTPFETEDGVGGFIVLLNDISERKRHERDAEHRLDDLAWIERIRDALQRDRFVLYAQPIVELAGGRVVQHELLIRMLDDDSTPVAPGSFLPVAEQYGLIGEIDRWVLRQSVALAEAGHSVELNLSAHSLSDATLYGFLDAELRRTGADPALLIFELTETAFMRNETAAHRFITAIAERGCGLALDDFGTGYGGFSYLKRLPVDYLKIDIEFVRDLIGEPASRQVVEAVVSLARGFGIKTVAEGVEDAATYALLRELGVDFAQGYSIGRPAPLHGTFQTPELCST